MKNKIKNLILDADGVFTDGSFYYTSRGKIMKKYGPDDADAITLLEGLINIHVITGDKKGYLITKKRIQTDMGLKLTLVSTFERFKWLKENYNPSETIYMGDGIFDSLVFKKVAYSIAPANALDITKRKATYVTSRKGGEGAVAEAIIHIRKKIFNIKSEDFESILKHGSGAWKNEK